MSLVRRRRGVRPRGRGRVFQGISHVSPAGRDPGEVNLDSVVTDMRWSGRGHRVRTTKEGEDLVPGLNKCGGSEQGVEGEPRVVTGVCKKISSETNVVTGRILSCHWVRSRFFVQKKSDRKILLLCKEFGTRLTKMYVSTGNLLCPGEYVSKKR